MKRLLPHLLRAAGVLCLVILAAGLIAPRLGADRYRARIQSALETALGRRVEIGAVHFNVFTGPGFSVDRVVIHEDPAFGIEPAAYVGTLEARPRFLSLFRRRLEFASIRLDDASINLAKSGAASEPGRWNFEPVLTRSLIMTFPEIHVRTGRINFKFGDTKSVFYLTDTDFDISPPGRGGAWTVRCSGAPARTDRPAHGFGAFRARGTWSLADRLDLDVELERSAVGEMITLVHGESAGLHGTISGRARLAGPLNDIRIHGRMFLEDIHRWDVLPPKGTGWPLNLAGRLDLPGQSLELESSSSGDETLPLSLRFQAADYLSRPRWNVALTWNRFPLAPLLELARHMGVPVPPRLALSGTLDGNLGYHSGADLEGDLAFHGTALTVPDSPPVRFEHARLLFAGGEVRLAPAVVRTANNDLAQLEGAWHWANNAFELSISTADMQVNSLRSQVALAAVPWLEQPLSGAWSGRLRYTSGEDGGWRGQVQIRNADFPVPGLAGPVRLESARARIDGARLVLDHIHARSGALTIQGEYRYEPGAARPDRFRLVLPQADAAALERLLAPTVYRRRGLLARALNLGRAPLPDWLATRRMEGTVHFDSLALGDMRLEKLRGRVLWDGARARIDHLTATLDGGQLSGVLNVNMRASRPAYLFAGRLKDADCRSGKVDVEGIVETRGAGRELMANLRSRGTFTAGNVELGSMPPLDAISGAYTLAWAQPEPRFTFTGLRLQDGEEAYSGAGGTQDDGRLLVVLTGGGKEMRVSGTLAKLKLDDTP